MPTWRLSRLQQRILRWLAADHQRTRGMIVSSHEDLVKALPADRTHRREAAIRRHRPRDREDGFPFLLLTLALLR